MDNVIGKQGQIMELKYVGEMPKLSKSGISFDHAKVDKYTYLAAAIELLEALNFEITDTAHHRYNTEGKELSSVELLLLLKKFCKDLDKVSDEREEKTNALITKLIKSVKENSSLTDEEKAAWLNNIEITRDYYLQYVTNKSAYESALLALAQEIKEAKIQEVSVTMFKNHIIVFIDLKPILETLKSPINSELNIEKTDKGLLLKVIFSHS